MLVRRIENAYEFESPTIDGVFVVKLTLGDQSEELLSTTMPVGVPASFIPRKLEPGTIRKAIGEKRWKQF